MKPRVQELLVTHSFTQNTVLRLKQGETLRWLIPAGSRILAPPYHPALRTNHPPDKYTVFDRETYYEVNRSRGFGDDWAFEMEMSTAGAFDFTVAWEVRHGSEGEEGESTYTERKWVGRFMVDPVLRAPGSSEVIPPEAVCLKTVITKCLDSADNWHETLYSPAADVGYNMIHFTPVQVLGESGSSYSVADQLCLSESVLPADMPTDEQFDTLEGIVNSAEGVLSIVDLVMNHTAHNSPWLYEHPEAGYTLLNTPHLRPAYLVDAALQSMSTDPGMYGLPAFINGEEDVNRFMHRIEHEVIPSLELWRFFVVRVGTAVAEFRSALSQNRQPLSFRRGDSSATFETKVARLAAAVTTDYNYSDSPVRVPVESALQLFAPVGNSPDDVTRAIDEYRRALDAINLPLYEKVNDHIAAIVNNVGGALRYDRLDPNGPRHIEVSKQCPIVHPYFTVIETGNVEHVLANNGWVAGIDPTVDFAASTDVYLRREVFIWGDCVKLRYGAGPSDSPWLWAHMRAYVESMATVFHGFRIDNCHSTPIHVAQYLMDAARKIDPNLFIVAELFTQTAEQASLYISRMGITAMFSEALMASTPKDLAHIVYSAGGEAVACLQDWKNERRLKPVSPHALVMDATHDNETPAQKRTAHDALPTAALVAMASAAVGSTLGYDLLMPERADIVSESRRYVIDPTKGMFPARAELNRLRMRMAKAGMTERHVHQVGDVITVHRHSPTDHRGIFLVARTAFHLNDNPGPVGSLEVPGFIKRSLLHMRLSISGDQWMGFAADPEVVNGLDCDLSIVHEPDFGGCITAADTHDNLSLGDFPPGSVAVFECTPYRNGDRHTLGVLRGALGLEDPRNTETAEALECLESLDAIVADFDYLDANVALYRCDAEEREATGGRYGVYDVPDHGKLEYAGLHGFMSRLVRICDERDMGHALLHNLRAGNWALGYTAGRLGEYSGRHPTVGRLRDWFEFVFGLVGTLPRYLIPLYFASAVAKVYTCIRERMLDGMSHFVSNSSPFVKSLAMTSVQMVGQASVGPPNMAAGLPHFSEGHMRCWGRDTFISLRGLLLVTGRAAEARRILLDFAAVLRHGQIPNLFASGVKPRYNARDTTWWFLQALQDYCEFEGSTEILEDTVVRRFPSDDWNDYAGDDLVYRHEPVENTVAEIVAEILQKHASGISYREWGAGVGLDSHMTSAGFEVSLRLDPSTGFIHGGNTANCGTWMDKMGESEAGGTMGVPATPRDGAPVELVALLYSTLNWLDSLVSSGEWPLSTTAVHLKGKGTLPYREWAERIADNFERYFHVPKYQQNEREHVLDPRLINRRGIYKDVYGSAIAFTQYQLRPNACIALVVAPDLFKPQHAKDFLNIVGRILHTRHLGIKTLDPADMQYRPRYDQNYDGPDGSIARGFSYHNGPEWVWPLGYYLRAVVKFSGKSRNELLNTLHSTLGPHLEHLKESNWEGLPELTNADGEPCDGSCPTQAWSGSTLLDALFDVSLVPDDPSRKPTIAAVRDGKAPATPAEPASSSR